MRTLSAGLTAAFDSTIFRPYIRVHIGSGTAGELAYSVQPTRYKLGALEASFTCVPPTTTLANITKFYIERGAILNGTPDTVSSAFFWVTEQLYDGRFLHVKGHILRQNIVIVHDTLQTYHNAIIEGTTDSSIDDTTIDYEGTPAWKNYNFLPSSRILNNSQYFLSLIKQKYLLYLREEGHRLVGGLEEHFSDIAVFCATDSRAQDYTITDQLFKFNAGNAQRYFLWRDEASTIHTAGSTNLPMHNLGYLESTASAPTNTNSPLAGSEAIVPIHLKYQRGDYVTINPNAAGDIHEYTGRIDVTEILDTDHEPAWYCKIEPLVHFTNTEGGALPSTIERVAAYTPLVTTNFDGNLDETVNNLQAFADKVDDLPIYNTEQVQDLVGAMITANSESGIDVTYDDTDGTLDFAVQNFVNNLSQSPTTADITAVVNTRHLVNISGLTADRNFKLPAGTAGQIIQVKITTGDDTYELILKGDTSITINGGSAATEWSRLFITGETVTFVATSATNWEVIQDGRIPCLAVFTRTSGNANTTHSAATDTKADWDTLETDVGNCGDTTNDRFNVRRANRYECSGAYAPAASIADQKYFNIVIYKNGTGGTRVQAVASRQSSTAGSLIAGVALSPKPHLCAVGDYLEYFFKTEDANMGLLETDYAGSGSAVVGYVTFFAVKELLPAA